MISTIIYHDLTLSIDLSSDKIKFNNINTDAKLMSQYKKIISTQDGMFSVNLCHFGLTSQCCKCIKAGHPDRKYNICDSNVCIFTNIDKGIIKRYFSKRI